jgi:cytochrome b561
VNRASHEFARIQSDADALSTRIKSLGSAIAGLGATGVAIGHIAVQFGLLNAEQGRVFNSAMMVVSVMGMFMRTSWGIALAQKVYAAACWVATAAQNALNVSYATFLALTGVGIAVIIAAAAAMWYFSSQMNAAAASVQNFNDIASEMPAYTRSIRRSGEEELYRRGVE